MIRRPASALACLWLLAPVAIAQDPGDVLARFTLDGAPAVVTRNDVALEMGFHLQRRERGRQACSHLVDVLLTRRAAEREGVMPSAEDVRAYWARLQEQLRAAGHKPEEFAAIRNASERQMLADLAVQVAQERLVRKALGLRADEAVRGEMLSLWIGEERKRAAPVTDPDALPVGTAARVGDSEIPIIDVGALLLRTSEDDEVAYYVRMAVFLRCLEAEAKRRGVTLDDTDYDAAIADYRRRAAGDPRLGGASWEQILEGEGLTVDSLRRQRVFRAKVLQKKLADVMFPDDQLAAELAGDRAAVLARIGPRRHLGIIFLRALDEPNGLIPLDFPAALAKLQELRRLLANEEFAKVARLQSQDPRTATKGGDAGWFRRTASELPDAVLAAAFALQPGEVSEPVRGTEGCFLVKVLDVEPMPSDAQLLTALRDDHAERFGQGLLDGAAITFPSAAPQPGDSPKAGR